MTRRRRPLSMMLLFVLLAGGASCGSSDDDNTSATTTSTLVAPISDKTMERTFTVEVKGAAQVSLKKQKGQMRFVVRESKGDQIAVSVASITFPAPIDLGEQNYLNPEIAIAGMYKGDGDYTLPAGIGPRPTTGPTAPPVGEASENPSTVSVAQVTTINLTPPASETRFGYLLQECKVTVKKGATEGKASCPALVAVNGETVSMTFEWGP